MSETKWFIIQLETRLKKSKTNTIISITIVIGKHGRNCLEERWFWDYSFLINQ